MTATNKAKRQASSKNELSTLSANVIDSFKNASHVQQAFVLAVSLPKILIQSQNYPDLLKVWTDAKRIFEKIHAQTVEEDTFVKPQSDAPPTKAKHIEKLVADLKIKHGTRHKATLKDFYRICETEKIEIITNLTKYSYCFSFDYESKHYQNISVGTVKKFTTKAAFHLLGGLLIPALHSAKKWSEGKIPKRALENKHSQSRYFSELMRGMLERNERNEKQEGSRHA